MPEASLVREKLDQAVRLLNELGLDAWLTLVSETGLSRDPALVLIYPNEVTWLSAFLVTRSGERLAILGRYDAENAVRLGAYSQVIPYDQSARPLLADALHRVAPDRLAVNFSRDDPAADGLTYGLKLVLDEVLAEAGLGPERVVSSEAFLSSLRGRKTPAEVAAIRRAVSRTESMLDEVGPQIRPGVTERQLAAYLHQRMHAENLEPAWELQGDPIVNTGPSAEGPGHAGPTDRPVEPGHLVHFDFGLRLEGFCADIQRMWYVLRPGESQPPVEVQPVWEAVQAALSAGARALRPGKRGWEVDQAARDTLVERGMPEYLHAFGHHLGRAAHDGSTVLGPRWERYGRTPDGQIEAGNVFAIELGAPVPGIGWIYLEEDVHVVEGGIEWLSHPQTELRVVKAEG